MVDALRFVHEIVTPEGRVVDLHPTDVAAVLIVGDQTVGPLDAGDAPQRHAAAGAAIAAAVTAGLFEVVASADFMFRTYGDSVEELRDHIAEHWRATRIGAALIDRARRMPGAAPRGGRPSVVEEVRLTVLAPRPRAHARS